MIIDYPAAVRSARTSVLRDNLATLRARRAAILAELESISTAILATDTGDGAPWVNEDGEIVPCGTCGNDFAEYNCTCELPPTAAYDW